MFPVELIKIGQYNLNAKIKLLPLQPKKVLKNMCKNTIQQSIEIDIFLGCLCTVLFPVLRILRGHYQT